MTYYMILLAIISNNILLYPPIVLTYLFISDGLLIQYISLSFYCSFEFLFTNISFVGTRLSLFGSPHGALQLTKAYRAESVKDDACVRKT